MISHPLSLANPFIAQSGHGYRDLDYANGLSLNEADLATVAVEATRETNTEPQIRVALSLCD